MVMAKKKSLNFDFISDLPILFPKSRCSLKKKKVFISIIEQNFEKSEQNMGNTEIDSR